MKLTTQYNKRYATYIFTILLLLSIGHFVWNFDWHGGVTIHTVIETVCTLLAYFVGILALIRYISQEDIKFLYIGSGFLGTALLDTYHTTVTSEYLLPLMPTEYAQLVPWSWSASRFFLSLLMCVSWLMSVKHENNPNFIVKASHIFFVTGLVALSCFMIFTLLPMPPISNDYSSVHRPFEFIPAVFFSVALFGYLRKGMWRDDYFEHCLVLSLIMGLVIQTVFMPFSAYINDAEFTLAHLFKLLSYLLVLIGLLISLYQAYIALRLEKLRRVQLEQELRAEAEALGKSEYWFRSIADYTYNWETWFSPEGKLLYISPSCKRISGYSDSEFLAGEITMLDILSPNAEPRVIQHFMVVSDDEGAKELDFCIVTKDHRERWISHASQPIYDEKGRFAGRRSSSMDITERKKLEEEVSQLAFYDTLTGLANRRLLTDRLAQAMNASQRSNCYGALMFLDLDNFKPLNDAHGHVVGDLLLQEVAKRLKGCVRGIDTVARFGGDEFVVMLSELSESRADSVAQTEVVAEKVRATLAEPYLLEIQHAGELLTIVEHHCSASIGVALFINHDASQDDILKWADDAMYQAKDVGRNRVWFFADANQQGEAGSLA